MKIKLTLIFFFSLLLNRGIGQVISGEANPCPETNYTYTFSGSSFNNYFLWSITDGEIISQNTNTVVVKWSNKVTENGKWKLRVQYETIKFDGTSGGSTYLDKDVKVNIPSRYTITGDNEIPGDFRGSKTYTAQIVNSNFPAASFVWTTNTGIQTTTTNPSFNLNITDDQVKWITVSGKSSTCPQWGEIFKFDIFYTPVFTGPFSFCSEGIYTIVSPGAISLENASGIATLTSLGNNQWKVTRIGNASGSINLVSTSNGKVFKKSIYVGPLFLGQIEGYASLKRGWANRLYELNEAGGPYTNHTWSINSNMITLAPNGTSVKLSVPASYNYLDPENGDWVTLKCTMNSDCGQVSTTYDILIMP
ncbi:hypothetical protein [Sphingobacterium sp.]|uniref:hypothetical protein n=1 Tax=Sphingobacterium sp. TaxID=341027 RepID=UPI0028A2C1A7|nr:hypothetical protein [Sphingobacterium sp.]